jgi:hypothetical protein
MLGAIWIIQMIVGERRLGRRTAGVAAAPVPGVAQLGATAA